MHKKIILLLAILVQTAFAGHTSLFVSFSMPEKLMEGLMQEAASLDIPVFLNGLIEDDMRKTLKGLFIYAQKYPNLSIQIDPYAFEKYHIKQVPALVIDRGKEFDVLYGNVRISDGLDWLKRKGEVK